MKNHFRLFLSALTAATLLFGGHFRAALDSRVRFLNDWSALDSTSLIIAVVLLAVAFYGCGLLLSRAGRPGPAIVRTAFLVLFVQGLLVTLRPPANSSSALIPLATGIAWCATAAFLIVCWRRARQRWLAWPGKAALLLSPIALILFVQVFQWPSGNHPPSPHPQAAARRSQAAPVIFIVCDEWSFERSFTNHSPLPDLPVLRRFAARSFVCTNAWSGGTETWYSLPALLFQTTNAFRVDRLGLCWPTNSGSIRARDLANLLSGFSERNLIGFYLPYSRFLPDLTFCKWHLLSPKGENLFQAVSYRFLDTLVYWQDPWIEALRNKFYLPDTDKPVRIYGPYWWKLNNTITREATDLLQQIGTNSITFLHLPIPHPPFVFKSDGAYQKPLRSLDKNPDQYHLSLLQMDRTLGKIFTTLTERNLFDRSLLVLTSDHTWRADLIRQGRPPGYDHDVRHVPLLIKWPGQTNAALVTNEIALTRISSLLQLAATGAPVEAAARLLKNPSLE